jgi:lipoprotein-anchoring transpeptidase ErfK/SrfK
MKLRIGKANRQKKATWVPGAFLGAFLGAVLAMTTVSAALQTPVSLSAPPRVEVPEFTKGALARTTVHWVLVSIPDRKLALFENGRVVRLYRVAVGKTSTPSPAGEFKIVNRVTNPTYYHKGQVVGAGKGNPVGTRWMGLSAKGYGIHGTNQPNSIGKAASTGCIRMGKQDLEELFAIVDAGDTVQIRAERDEQIAAVFGTGMGTGAGDGTATETIAQVETEKSPGNGQ